MTLAIVARLASPMPTGERDRLDLPCLYDLRAEAALHVLAQQRELRDVRTNYDDERAG